MPSLRQSPVAPLLPRVRQMTNLRRREPDEELAQVVVEQALALGPIAVALASESRARMCQPLIGGRVVLIEIVTASSALPV